jgi:DegV family protein with EDD domain
VSVGRHPEEIHLAGVRIVTDSAASFQDQYFVEDHNVSVVPLNVHFGTQVLRDGLDIDAEETFDRMRHNRETPRVTAPSIHAFETVYQELGRQTDQIVVLCHSQRFTQTYDNAQSARGSLLGRCDITVVDTRTVGAGLGFVVEAAARAASKGALLEDVVHVARAALPRVYVVFYVYTLEHIQSAGLIGQTQSLLGTMLEIKPLLTIEDGTLITMEKARSHAQAIDKMIEFVAEFTDIQQLCILQSTRRVTDRTRMLQDRLALEFARLKAPLMLYDPLIASFIGPDGMGLAMLEGSGEGLDTF